MILGQHAVFFARNVMELQLPELLDATAILLA